MKTNKVIRAFFDKKLVGTLLLHRLIKWHLNIAMTGFKMDFQSVHFLFR